MKADNSKYWGSAAHLAALHARADARLQRLEAEQREREAADKALFHCVECRGDQVDIISMDVTAASIRHGDASVTVQCGDCGAKASITIQPAMLDLEDA